MKAIVYWVLLGWLQGSALLGVADTTNRAFALPLAAAPADLALTNEPSCVDVLRFGADPTARQDSRNAFQAAFNAARTNHGTVIVPPGDYRIVAGMPIVMHGCGFRGLGGRLWISLPEGYTRPDSYVIPDAFMAANMLDGSGATVRWDSTNPSQNLFAKGYYGFMPWNGKTVVFTGAGSDSGTPCLVENIWVNGGWGVTNAPGSVIPINGLKRTWISPQPEYEYYQIFAPSNNVTFRWCHFADLPGSAIAGGSSLRVEECFFGEYAGHAVVNTNGAHLAIAGSVFRLSRPTSGTEGKSDFVFQTCQEAITLVNCTDATVTGCDFRDENTEPIASFIELQSIHRPPLLRGDNLNVCAVSNCFHGFRFCFASSERASGAADDGSRLKNTRIAHNEIEITANNAAAFQLPSLASDTFAISSNHFTLQSTSMVMLLQGSYAHDKAVTRFAFNDNVVIADFVPSRLFSIAGVIEDIELRRNVFIQRNIYHDAGSLIVRFEPYLTYIDSMRPRHIKQFVFAGNWAENFFALVSDGGFPAWNSGFRYDFDRVPLPGGASICPRVVEYDGVLYTNCTQVTGTNPPSMDTTNWGAYTPPTGRVDLQNNVRVCNSSNPTVGTNAPMHLAYNTGLRPLSQTYQYSLSGNINLADVPGANFKSEIRHGARWSDQVNIVTHNAPYVVIQSDYALPRKNAILIAEAARGNITIQLPSVAGASDPAVELVAAKNDGTEFGVTLKPAPGQKIGGAETLVLTNRWQPVWLRGANGAWTVKPFPPE